MNSYELLKILIGKVESYSESSVDKELLSTEGFIRHLQIEQPLDNLKNNFISSNNTYSDSEKSNHRENTIERVISQHILFLYRYIKFYSKHVFVESRVKSMEEFGIMMTVMQHRSISKSDLIKKNVIDKSGGIEIINRLIKSGMLLQQDNPNDNRSQLILLSQSGMGEVYTLFANMEVLGTIATGELTQVEKFHLAELLKKLDHFHYENYSNKKLKTLEDYTPKKHNK